MQAVPTTRQLAQHAPRRVEINIQPMAIPYVGNRYSGAFSFGNKADEVPRGCHRILHEVDRSRTSSTDHGPQGPALRVEEHSLLFRDPEKVSI